MSLERMISAIFAVAALVAIIQWFIETGIRLMASAYAVEPKDIGGNGDELVAADVRQKDPAMENKKDAVFLLVALLVTGLATFLRKKVSTIRPKRT